jgi:hypothetical protein
LQLAEDWNKLTIDVRLIEPEILVEEMRGLMTEGMLLHLLLLHMRT